MIAFFDLPNPRIFTLFMISSTATFCLGIALILEWGLYSQYHPGYHWIVYYAPCLISLPILIWMFCILFATFVVNKDRSLRIVPSFDPSISTQPQSQGMHHQQSQIKEDRLVEEKCQLEQVGASTNRLALVPVQPVHDLPSVSIKVEAAKAKNGTDDKSTLKRTFSLSLVGNKSFDHDNIKRTMSLRSVYSLF